MTKTNRGRNHRNANAAANRASNDKNSLAVDEITLPEGCVAFYLDENGNKVWLSTEDTAKSAALEAELKQQEEEPKALDEAEKKWRESRKDRIERFPFEPTPHPEIAFDKDACYNNEKVR